MCPNRRFRARHLVATLVLVSVATAAACRPAARARRGGPFDIVIRNGRILDGTGSPPRRADVAVRDGRVVAIGRVDGDVDVARVIDAAGRLVTPGFIDVHSHAGPGLGRELNHAQPIVAQGITTVVVNPDGGGPVDLASQRARYERRRTSVNVAMFVPHGSVREAVVGMDDRAPTAAELTRMIQMVRAGMRAGAVGLSSGPYYAPGSYARTDELIALARAAAAAGGVYSSHIRDEGDYGVGLLAAVQEVIDIAEQAKLPGIVTHMKALGVGSWGLTVAATERMRQARARGVDVYADQYPYDASGTGIVGALIPRWALVGGRQQLLTRIAGRERAELAAAVRANLVRRGGPDSLVVSRYEPDPPLEGQTLGAIAKARNRTPEDTALDLLVEADAALVSFNMSEKDIAHVMRQPFTMTCTDGDLVPLGEGKPHPRAYGAFPRKLRVYVGERHVIDLPFAIRSMTSLPASVFGFADRGVVREGAWADLVVFDPASVRDTATYAEPHRLAEGMAYVLVNGVIVRDAGRPTGALPGVVVTVDRRP